MGKIKNFTTKQTGVGTTRGGRKVVSEKMSGSIDGQKHSVNMVSDVSPKDKRRKVRTKPSRVLKHDPMDSLEKMYDPPKGGTMKGPKGAGTFRGRERGAHSMDELLHEITGGRSKPRKKEPKMTVKLKSKGNVQTGM